MKHFSTLTFLLLTTSFLFAQQYDNMLLRGVWDDNALPVKYGTFSYNDVWGYSANGFEYGLIGTMRGMVIIDITNPTLPQEVIRIDGGYTSSLWRDIKTFQSYAYTVADETSSQNQSGLQIIELGDLPITAYKVYESSRFFQRAHNIFIDEPNGRLYAVGTDTRNDGVIIFDLNADPANPDSLASVSLPGGYVHDLYVRNDTAYCNHGNNGLYIYDMTNPGTPVTLGTPLTTYPNQGYNHSSWLTDDGNYLIFADENNNRYLKVLDVQDFSNLTIVSSIKSTLLAPNYTNSIAHNPIIKGDSVYISYYHEGIQIYDISNPLRPQRVSYYDTEPNNTTYGGSGGAWGVYPFLPSGRVLGSDIRHGLFVLEPQLPVLAIDQLTLQASATARGSQLEWKVPTDHTLSSFEITRTEDGRTYEVIGKKEAVAGQGDYIAWDEHPVMGPAFYRVKVTDLNGATRYSALVKVTTEPGPELVEVFPNPLGKGESLQLRMNSPAEMYAVVSLFDLQGRQVIQEQWDLKVGISVREMTLPPLAEGLYVLSIATERGVVQEKIRMF